MNSEDLLAMGWIVTGAVFSSTLTFGLLQGRENASAAAAPPAPVVVPRIVVEPTVVERPVLDFAIIRVPAPRATGPEKIETPRHRLTPIPTPPAPPVPPDPRP